MHKKEIQVFVSGDFNILHPGHMRLLKFAKESGTYLSVGVHSDALASNKGVSQEERLESIKATSYVDYAFILDIPAVEYIQKHQPAIVVKGKEFENRENIEEEIIKSYHGKLLFSSGEIGFSSLKLLQEEFAFNEQNVAHSQEYIKRHKIDFDSLQQIVNQFNQLNVLVIGDTIVDEYITCDPIGMSQEDPTIVVTPILNKKFIGGAAIVAGHAKTLGANVNFISVVGDDENKQFIHENLSKLGINTSLYKDTTRPTTLKQRFRASNKTLLRVNHLKQHSISKDIEQKILNEIKNNIDKLDLIIFSDFSYGVLTDDLIQNIAHLGNMKHILMAADSQSSSQVGDISKFHNMTLLTPTEREIRLALNDFESGLVVASEELVKKTNAEYVFTTLGSEGMMIYNTHTNQLLTDNIPALGKVVKDISGAGDSLLITSAMALSAGANIFQSAYLGSIAAAVQVSSLGNVPISKEKLLSEIT
jgi:rfaE bifunctional protein kinase chain/domain